MNYSKIKHFDVANGDGVRTTIFVSGCDRHCPGCFNSETWDFNHGELFTEEVLKGLLQDCDYPQCAGLSILGGEPLNRQNILEVQNIVMAFRKKFGHEKTIWMWTGNTVEELYADEEMRAPFLNICKQLDYLIDGAFILAKKNLNLPYCGSTNQRVIDMAASVTNNKIILKKD